METWIGLGILVSSLLFLIILLMKNSQYRMSLRKIAIHWILAAVFLFALNASDITSSFAVPISPFTLSTIVLLGIPGLALVQGVYILM